MEHTLPPLPYAIDALAPPKDKYQGPVASSETPRQPFLLYPRKPATTRR